MQWKSNTFPFSSSPPQIELSLLIFPGWFAELHTAWTNSAGVGEDSWVGRCSPHTFVFKQQRASQVVNETLAVWECHAILIVRIQSSNGLRLDKSFVNEGLWLLRCAWPRIPSSSHVRLQVFNWPNRFLLDCFNLLSILISMNGTRVD